MNKEVEMRNQADLFKEMRGQLTSTQAIKEFALAGNATITVRSKSTDRRFTFKIRKPRKLRNPNQPIWFVSLLTGCDNENHYQYFGEILSNNTFRHGQRADLSKDAVGVLAFTWFWNTIQANREDLLELAAVWHEGKCGRCGRKLTVPESIESGFGPECINFV